MTVSDDTLVTNHRIVLEDLIPETTYAFQIVAEDESGNQAEPASDSFITAPPPVKKFKLTVSVDGPGSVVVEPSKPEYDSGDEVKLTAVPTWPKWFLASWSINDNPAGDENPLTVVITEDTNVEATILRYQFNYLPLVRAD
jgi:hypothetical protein